MTQMTNVTPSLRCDVLGRLNNMRVGLKDSFIPLFEAVVNSIQATEDRFGKEVNELGTVDVKLYRVPQQSLPTVGRPPIEPIVRIEIVDNGIGFTEKNLNSFLTADSRAKFEKGGKGVGRFTWLKVFEKAVINSVFRNENNEPEKISLEFCPTTSCFENFKRNQNVQDKHETKITLQSARARYRNALRHGSEYIADRLFEHCFNYFVLGSCPKIRIIDSATNEPVIVVNNKAEELTLSDPKILRIKGFDFKVSHVQWKFSSASRRGHEAHLCGNNRVVTSFSLTDTSGLSPEPIQTDDGPVIHQVFVSGPVLDSAVNTTRTKLELPEDEPLFAEAGELDLKTIREEIGNHVAAELYAIIQAGRQANFKKVVSHIRTKQPEYRHLIERVPDEISSIRWTDNARQLDESLYKVSQDWEFLIRQKRAQLEEQLLDEDVEIDDLTEKLTKAVEETSEVGQANLVRYVTKRKVVLDLLTRMVSRFGGGPALEKEIHGIVFPMKKFGDDVPLQDHNLWLVDDQLAFYEFISSDQPLRKFDAAPSDSLERPDILAFKTGDFQHVALVEFKKPDKKDDPVAQLVRYGQRLRKGGVEDANGLPIPGISKHRRIDAYAIMTLTPQVEELLQVAPGNLSKVEGEWRWYGFIKGLNMTVEVLDFRAFISRARNRNQAFFRALQLPTI